ncbi:MAG: hypothetical protein ACAI25_08700 [Planctomycetota bacterium]
MDGIFMAITGVGGALAAVGVYFGRLNLTQAGVLANPTPFSRLEHNVGRCVALRARPRAADGAQYIWCRRKFQHYHTHHHHDSSGHHDHTKWTTDSTQVDARPFHIEEGGIAVHVQDQPDEVYGTVSHTEGSDGLFTLPGATRVLVETLPIGTQLTVCGRLSREGSRWVLRRDRALGLLVSANNTSSQATHEAIKGWLGVVGAPLAWLIGSLVAYKHFHPR